MQVGMEILRTLDPLFSVVSLSTVGIDMEKGKEKGEE